MVEKSLLKMPQDRGRQFGHCPHCGASLIQWAAGVLVCSRAKCRKLHSKKTPPVDPATVTGPLRVSFRDYHRQHKKV